MGIFDKKNIIKIAEDDLQDAKLSSIDFADENTKKRAFIDVLGARLAMKLLFSKKIEAGNLYSMYTIHNVLERLDIADIYFNNIKIDVRLIFGDNGIFIPKSQFRYNILPDLYLVLELKEDLSSAELLGFFDPNAIDKNDANSEFYFYDKEKLQKPEDLKKFLGNFKPEDRPTSTEEELERAESLFLSSIDNEISEKDRSFLFQQLSTNFKLRENFVELENFELISARAVKEKDILKDNVLDIVGAQKIAQEEDENLELETINFGELEDLQDFTETEEFSEIEENKEAETVEGENVQETKEDKSFAQQLAEGAIIAGGATLAAGAVGAMAATATAAVASSTQGLASVGAVASGVASVAAGVAAGGANIADGLASVNDLNELTDSKENYNNIADEIEEYSDIEQISNEIEELPEEIFADESSEEPIEPIEPIDSAEEIEKDEPIEDIEPMEEVDSIEEIEPIEDIETVEGIEEDLNVEYSYDDDENDSQATSIDLNEDIGEEFSINEETDGDNQADFGYQEEESLDESDSLGELPTIGTLDELEEFNALEEFDSAGELENINESTNIEEIAPLEENEAEAKDDVIDLENFDFGMLEDEEDDVTEEATQNEEDLVSFNNLEQEEDIDAEEEENIQSPTTQDVVEINNSELDDSEIDEEKNDIGELSDITNQVDELLKQTELTDEQKYMFADEFNIDDKTVEENNEIQPIEAAATTEQTDNTQDENLDIDMLLSSTSDLSDEEEKDLLKVLFKKENINEDEEMDLGSRETAETGEHRQKKVIIAASVAGVMLISLVAGGLVINNKKADVSLSQNSNTPPISADVQQPTTMGTGMPDSSATTDTSAMQMQSPSSAMPDTTGQDTLSGSPAEGQQYAPQPNRDMGQAVSEAFMSEPVNASVSKIAWEVPEDLAYNDSFRKYLQSAGKNLKLTLQNDLLLATELAYSNKMIVDLTISKSGVLQSENVAVSSGSKQIDKIVLQSVKETLKYLKMPSSEVSGSSVDATLIINF